MELILLNMKLLGQLEDQDLTKLLEYCNAVAQAVGWEIPINYPLVGRDAFRTGDRGARGGDHQGDAEGGRLARRPDLLAACRPGCSGASRRSASAS